MRCSCGSLMTAESEHSAQAQIFPQFLRLCNLTPKNSAQTELILVAKVCSLEAVHAYKTVVALITASKSLKNLDLVS